MAKKRLYHSVAQQITVLIKEGEFPPGSRLPGERDLAERFGVSRVTIREAAIALEALGMIDIRTGSGIYVCKEQPRDSMSVEEVSAFELTEARSLFEGEAAALAAPVISEEKLQELDRLIKEMSSHGDDEAATNADREFHRIIAQSCGNAVVLHVIELLWRMRMELPQVQGIYETVCLKDIDYRAQEHQAILDALRARAPAAARAAMRNHFHRLLEAMLDAKERLDLQDLQKKATESRERFLKVAQLI